MRRAYLYLGTDSEKAGEMLYESDIHDNICLEFDISHRFKGLPLPIISRGPIDFYGVKGIRQFIVSSRQSF